MSNVSKFMNLKNIPNLEYGDKFVVVFNVASKTLYSIKQSSNVIWEYSTLNDSWKKHMIQPVFYVMDKYHKSNQEGDHIPTAAVASTKNIIYYYDNEYLTKIKISDNGNNGIMCRSETIAQSQYIKNVGPAPKGVILNDEFNIFGHSMHYKYNESLNKFEIEHELDFLDSEGKEWNAGHGIAIVKNDKVLVFGGRNTRSDYNRITNVGGECTDVIHQFNVRDNEWTKLSVKTPRVMQSFGCCSVLQGKYVLIFGGKRDCNGGCSYFNDIEIYSVKDQYFRRSGVKCPMYGPCQAVAVSDEYKDGLICVAYMKDNWKQCEINNHLFPPNYLIAIIAKYYFEEFIHLFHFGTYHGNWHYKINVFDIIND